MAIIKRTNKSGISYQLRIRGSDGYWLTETFKTKEEAKRREVELRHKQHTGVNLSANANRLTLAEYFTQWEEQTRTGRVSPGWRNDQIRDFNNFVAPHIGHVTLAKLTPATISRVFVEMTKLGKAPQTQLHVYNLLHKLCGDAVELFRILHYNPVTTRLRPKLIRGEIKYLTIEQSAQLLRYVQGKRFECAIALGLLGALRVGEIQALKWGSIDLTRSTLMIRGTYVRKEERFKDYPKSRTCRRIPIPEQLCTLLTLRRALLNANDNDYVAAEPGKPFLDYNQFLVALRRYCKECSLPIIGTHGLRHSASEIYLEHGGTRDDLRQLYRHSSASITDTYVHDRGLRLERVTKKVKLTLVKSDANEECSQNVPKSSFEHFDEQKQKLS